MKEKSWDEVLGRYLKLADMESLRMIADDFALQCDKDSLDMVCDEIEARNLADSEMTEYTINSIMGKEKSASKIFEAVDKQITKANK